MNSPSHTRMHKNQGFTILETVVAIGILLISIAGPLTIAEKGLTEAVSSQDQMTASYLAQDLMEYIKNVRDDNMLDSNSLGNPSIWLVSQDGTGIDLSTCTAGNSHCDFDTTNSAAVPTFAPCTQSTINANLCQLYLTPTGTGTSYYTPNSTRANLSPTKFSRAFTVSIPTGETANTATSSLVTVTVAWKTGGVANQVVIRDMLFNTLR